jgi:signal transduction histidine kinase
VADSDRIDGTRRDFSTRPEIAAALDGKRASGTRPSKTLRTDLVYVAVPVASGGAIHGAVRVTYPTSTLDARVRSTWLRLGALCAVVLAVVAVVGLVLARSVTRPVRRLEQASSRLAAGDLEARVDMDGGAPELRALAETFNATAERLALLVESQRRFVADASHQLRTPLTALRLRLETLALAVPEATRPKLDAAVAETARLGRLVQSLLVLARSDASSPDCAPVNLTALVEDRVASWREVAVERGIEVVVGSATPARAWAAPDAVEQILDNLMSNAIEAAPVGSTVTVSVVRRDPWVELHVIDAGPGIAPEDRERVFERFWRPPGASTDGFGLGLAIVRELAEACGGTIRLESAPQGRGLDAVVRLAPDGRDSRSPRRRQPPVADQDANPALTSA